MSSATDSFYMRRDLREAIDYNSDLLDTIDDAEMGMITLTPDRLAEIARMVEIGKTEISRLREALEGMDFD
jgi:hypothetical protein